MSERDAVLSTVLRGTIWAAWSRQMVAGDASARRYFRLVSGEASVLVMDAPPDLCPDTARFVEIAEWLGACGLQAPKVLLADLSRGVLVLSDLGPTDLATHLRAHPQEETKLYQAAVDILVKLEQVTPPAGLTRLTPTVGADMIGILSPHYTTADLSDLQSALHHAMADILPEPETLALRDFHAENLIWRAGEAGTDRVGLLDFQDAFIAPPGYDLASLLRDARRDVSPETVAATISHYANQTGRDLKRVHTEISTLALQRNLRILGVFAKLARVDGKPRYLKFMSRVWEHILTDLAHDALARLRAAVLETLPAPTPDYLEGLLK
jgi:aminoglycoside/choline kinase family phosphotransferase